MNCMKTELNISYDKSKPHCLLDIYLPDKQDNPTPAVVVIHGGGFHMGSKNGGREVQICETLADAGFAAFSIDYKLAEDSNHTHDVFPENIHDCKTAVRWIRANAGKYGLDPERIGAIGGSAGGWLALCLGLTEGYDYFDPPGEGDTGVNAVVNLYGPTDNEWRAKKHGYEVDLHWARKHSPVNWVTTNSPPLLTLHGTDDKIVLPMNAELLKRACKRVGSPHELIWVEGAPHTFPIQNGHHDFRQRIIDFFSLSL